MVIATAGNLDNCFYLITIMYDRLNEDNFYKYLCKTYTLQVSKMLHIWKLWIKFTSITNPKRFENILKSTKISLDDSFYGGLSNY